MTFNLTHVQKISVLSILALLVLASWLAPIDKPAIDRVDSGMKRALITFASARALNAAISVAQGTEVSFSMGAGVTLSVGEVLDPVNDLVEQFSNFMLIATVAFGVQKALLMMGQYEYVKVFLTAIMFVWGALYFSGWKTPRWFHSLFILMLMVRFAIPVATFGTDVLFKQFLEKDYQSSLVTIGTVTDKVKQPLPQQQAAPPNNQGWFGGLKNWPPTALDPMPKLDELQQKADQASKDVVQLIVVFLLQTLLIPILMLLALYLVLRSVISK
ncbi:MAG: hypothetical protein Q8M09_13540 [Pseudomonadota bacterium]|nr:hypothetical protein [Pseudomonadota bacterium]MDP1905251.1 hypothetical protein [Pseudomonadota bacterium]MDP2352536.1 hypothetical protein [Pseudomonadota bacterium]